MGSRVLLLLHTIISPKHPTCASPLETCGPRPILPRRVHASPLSMGPRTSPASEPLRPRPHPHSDLSRLFLQGSRPTVTRMRHPTLHMRPDLALHSAARPHRGTCVGLAYDANSIASPFRDLTATSGDIGATSRLCLVPYSQNTGVEPLYSVYASPELDAQVTCSTHLPSWSSQNASSTRNTF